MTIGVIGCGPGSGVTHLTIALSNYCSSRLRQNTACLELHSRNELSQLSPQPDVHTHCDRQHTHSGFRIQKVDYYPSVCSEMIPVLLNRGYGYLILDLGNIKEADHQEFLRCDKKLVLGSLSPWKKEKYQEFFHTFDKTMNLGEGFHYLVQTGTYRNILDFSRTNHIFMRNVPFINNPFHIEKELFLFLQELL